jgi:hypothetical protein
MRAIDRRTAFGATAAALSVPADRFWSAMGRRWDEWIVGCYGGTRSTLAPMAAQCGVGADRRTTGRRSGRSGGRRRTGAAELLDRLRSDGFLIGLISDCSSELCKAWPTTPSSPGVRPGMSAMAAAASTTGRNATGAGHPCGVPRGAKTPHRSGRQMNCGRCCPRGPDYAEMSSPGTQKPRTVTRCGASTVRQAGATARERRIVSTYSTSEMRTFFVDSRFRASQLTTGTSLEIARASRTSCALWYCMPSKQLIATR